MSFTLSFPSRALPYQYYNLRDSTSIDHGRLWRKIDLRNYDKILIEQTPRSDSENEIYESC